MLVVAALTAVGLGLRLALLGQSLFADELSTWWIVSTHGLGGVVSTVHSDAEITPPLYFVLAWLTTRLDLTPELLRLPSLVAGVATVPLTYLLGARTVGRPVGLVGATLVALSPFMLFYSTEARGYALAVALVLCSTLALLAAVESGRGRWWVLYVVCSCAAVLTHYTTVFALAAQLAWALWAHPKARRPALMANAAAAVGFLPWITGLINDFESPTTDIVNAIDVLTLHSARVTLEHWTVGHPLVLANAPLRALPGRLALVLLAFGLATAVAGALRAWRRSPPLRLDDRLALVVALALGAPAGVLVVSVVGTNLVSVRHLAASWPALSLVAGALIVAAGPRVRIAAGALVIACFAIGAVKMLEPRFQRPDYQAVGRAIDREARPGDVVIDGTSYSPAPISPLDAALHRGHKPVHLGIGRVQFDPFRILAGPPPPGPATRRALAASPRGRVFVVSSETILARSAPPRNELTEQVLAAIPSRYRRVELRRYPGILRLALLVYAPRK
jgi:mannosyltransferase